MANINFRKTNTRDIHGIDVNGLPWGALRYVPATKTRGASASMSRLSTHGVLFTTSDVPTTRGAIPGPTLREAKAHAIATIRGLI